MAQFHLRPCGADLPCNVVEGHLRHVSRAVTAAVRRHTEEQQSHPAADLQDPLWSKRQNPRDGGIHVLAHLAGGDRLSRVAAAPSDGVEGAIRRSQGPRIGDVVHHLPALDLLAIPFGPRADLSTVVHGWNHVGREPHVARRGLARHDQVLPYGGMLPPTRPVSRPAPTRHPRTFT